MTARRGIPAPIQATRRWPVERTFAWGNQFGKLRWCTERDTAVVEFWLALAHAIIVLGRLIRQAWTCYRWEDRPSAAPDPPAYWRSLSGDSRLCGAAFAQVAANRLGEDRRSDDRLLNDDPWLTSSGCACSTPRSMR